MNKKEWTLLAISFADDAYLSPAQLQKSLFLFEHNKPRATGSDFYDFIPYNYGPFSSEIYFDVKSLCEEGLVKLGRPVGQRWIGYCITKEGRAYRDSLKANVPREDHVYLSKIVKWARSLTFRQLLSYIYKKFPQYKVNSVFMEW